MEHLSHLRIDDYDVDLRLRQLGLSRPPLVRAVGEGELQRSMCTEDDFAATPGFVAWALTLRTMRAGLRERHQFTNDTFLGIPVAFSPSRTVAIATSSADDRTGIVGDDPATQAKGPSTALAVEDNIPAQQALQYEEDSPVELWYLLFHSSAEGGVYAELSMPALLDPDNRISRWHERILLGRIDPPALDESPVVTSPSPRIDIPVRRKR